MAGRRDTWRARLRDRLRAFLGVGSGRPWEGFLPLAPDDDAYLVPAVQRPADGGLPVPPKDLWLGYGETEREYLESARTNIDLMREVLVAAGTTLESHRRILDFGCGAGRMIRFLEDLAAGRDIWGVDISARHVVWCDQNLNPPFQFVLTTTAPHLPFEDRSFDLAYAGSVFTHIDDLAKTWFVELRRVLAPGGHLYVTIHDRDTLRLYRERPQDLPVSRRLGGDERFRAWAASDFATFTIGRGPRAQVFYDLDHLRDTLRGLYDVVSVNPGAYGAQTALLLHRI